MIVMLADAFLVDGLDKSKGRTMVLQEQMDHSQVEHQRSRREYRGMNRRELVRGK